MTSFNLNYILTPNTATLEVMSSTYEFGGEIIQSMAIIK